MCMSNGPVVWQAPPRLLHPRSTHPQCLQALNDALGIKGRRLVKVVLCTMASSWRRRAAA